MSTFPSWFPFHRAAPEESLEDQRLVTFLKEHAATVPPATPDLENALMDQIMVMALPNSQLQQHSLESHHRSHQHKWWVALSLVLVCFSGAGALWFRPNAPQLTIADEEAIEKSLVANWSVDQGNELNDLGLVSEESQSNNRDELDLENEIALIYQGNDQSNEITEPNEPE